MCPVCRFEARRFLSFGDPPRKEALCPSCGSLERHRLIWLFLQRSTELFSRSPERLLHVAPEPCFEASFRALIGVGYLTADLHSSGVMERMSITDIPHPEGSFDAVFCSHVLEHVLDDEGAIREFFRVLRPGGWAILQVPITATETLEDPAVTDPGERKRRFGQEDHVRRYGPDYADRLRKAGFLVDVSQTWDLADPAEIQRMGLKPDEWIFFCRKP